MHKNFLALVEQAVQIDGEKKIKIKINKDTLKSLFSPIVVGSQMPVFSYAK